MNLIMNGEQTGSEVDTNNEEDNILFCVDMEVVNVINVVNSVAGFYDNDRIV